MAVNSPAPRWTDEHVEQIVGRLLQIGVTLAAAVVVLGGIVYLARHGMETPDYAVFRGEPADLRAVDTIVVEAFSFPFRGRPLIQLGLLLLVATPIARVLLSVVAFARQRDRAFVVITLVVAAVLFFSLFGGHE